MKKLSKKLTLSKNTLTNFQINLLVGGRVVSSGDTLDNTKANSCANDCVLTVAIDCESKKNNFR